ncbi:unnamed protein product [Heterobilharzia americana]|nr:unnamed protein product [Heterobilharzia americana]
MSSPISKGSAPKGENSPKDKFKDVEEPSVFQTPPPPPPDPPKCPLLSRLRRQVWYPYANRITFEHREWFWSPYCPLITSRVTQYTPPIIRKGEPRIITEIPRTGRIACLSTCPKAKKAALILYDPETLKEENRTDFKYEVLPSSLLSIQNEVGQPNEYKLEDDSTPTGMYSNMDLLFILFQPIQKLRVLNPTTLKPIDFRLENAFADESTCIHLATSGGYAASENSLFVAATRPPTVQIFSIHRQRILSQTDRINIKWYSGFGLDRLSIGEPYGIQIDSLGLLVVSDSRGGYMRVYNTFTNKNLPRPGHFSLGKNGTACIVDRWSKKLAITADRTIFRWYEETLLALDDALLLRPVVDHLMPINGLPALPMLADETCDVKRSSSQASLPIPDDILLPGWIVKQYQRDDLPANPPSPKSPPKSKKSSKNRSPKSSSGKSKKK